jgi:hypothetical protein
MFNEAIPVDFGTMGLLDDFSVSGGDRVPARTRVESYLLHFDPVPGAQGERKRGSVTFPNDILGIIATPATLAATDARLGIMGATYDGTLSGRSVDNSDLDTIDWNGRRLDLDFVVADLVDEVRVVVHAPPADVVDGGLAPDGGAADAGVAPDGGAGGLDGGAGQDGSAAAPPPTAAGFTFEGSGGCACEVGRPGPRPMPIALLAMCLVAVGVRSTR